MPKYDFMSFGEPNIRLTPLGHDRFGQTDEMRLGIAAAELNCCVDIANLSVEKLLPTMKTAYITKLVDNWTGRYIVSRAQMYGVDMSNIVVEDFDKIGRVRNGLAFIELGLGPRPSYQIYDRGHSALSLIKPGDIDWDAVLDTRWFHTTGIVTPLGEHTAGEVMAAIRAAKRRGAVVSYDINYRSTLWSREEAAAVIGEIIPLVDVVFGGAADFEAILGVSPGQEAAAADAPELYRAAAAKVMERYPNLKALATTQRWVHSALLNDWQGYLLTGNGFYASRRYENVEINDRVGSGDSYASAIIWGMLSGLGERENVELAAAYSALCHTVRNDWCLVSREEAQALADGMGAGVRR